MNIYSYSEWLNSLTETKVKVKKSDRTQNVLKIATAELLNETPYQNLHISAICKKADVGAGTFYRYFDGKKEITESVLIDVAQQFANLMSSSSKANRSKPLLELFTQANLTYFRFANENQGLFRCLLHASDQEYDLGLIGDSASASWSLRFTESILLNHPELNKESVLVMANCLASMLDDVIARLTFRQDRSFSALLDKNEINDEKMAEFVAVLWYRVIFGCDPKGASPDVYFQSL